MLDSNWIVINLQILLIILNLDAVINSQNISMVLCEFSVSTFFFPSENWIFTQIPCMLNVENRNASSKPKLSCKRIKKIQFLMKIKYIFIILLPIYKEYKLKFLYFIFYFAFFSVYIFSFEAMLFAYSQEKWYVNA